MTHPNARAARDPRPEAPPRIRALVIGLGSAQLVAWATLYYAIAVIGRPMREELGLRESQLFGAFAWSLALSGLLAPWTGKAVDRLGGRVVLGASVSIGACGFAWLAHAHSFLSLIGAWSINGLAMALGLYDTCFAALGYAAPLAFRRAVTGVTLLGGLASSVGWPASHYLVDTIGWRGTCLAFSASLLACLPLYLSILPAHAPRSERAERTPGARLENPAPVLSLAFAGAAWVAGALSAHLVQTLRAAHFASEEAVWLASIVGVMQVFGRLLELALGSAQNAVRLGFVTFTALTLALALLLATQAVPQLVWPFVVLYGIANGLATIAKAALPVELFGLRNVGAILGRFSAPSLVARAVAPFAFASSVDAFGVQHSVAAVFGVSALALCAYAYAVRSISRRPEARSRS